MQSQVKRVSFRVRRRYFDLIVKGEKKEEIRTDKPYWRRILLSDDPPRIAVFVCGKDVHHRWIRGKPYLANPEKVLGRPLSEQGIKDVLSNPAIVTPLGEKAIPLTCIPGGPPDYKEVLLGWASPSEIKEYESHNNIDCLKLDESLNKILRVLEKTTAEEWDKTIKEFKEVEKRGVKTITERKAKEFFGRA